MTDDLTRNGPASSFGPPQDKPNVTWGLLRLLIGTVIFMFLPTLAWFTGSNEEELDRDVLLQSAIINLAWYGAMAVLVYLLVRGSHGDWRNLGFRRPSFAQRSLYESARNKVHEKLHFSMPRMLVASIVGYLGCYGVILLYSIVVNASGLESGQPDPQIPTRIFDDQLVLVLIGFSVLGAAPLVEEIFFRGFLFGGLRQWMAFLPAALISGFIFSTAHSDVGLIVPFTLIGVILAYTYERTGTIYGSMSVHFVFNLVSFSLLILFPELRDQ